MNYSLLNNNRSGKGRINGGIIMAKKKIDRNVELKIMVTAYLYRSGYNKSELAEKLQISQSSLYNKLNNIDRFTLWEFRRLIQIMQLDEKQIMCLCA